MNVEISNSKRRMFLGDALPNEKSFFSPMHRHMYAEIHLVFDGVLHIECESREYVVCQNEAVMIPPAKYHETFSKGRTVVSFAFQSDCDINDITIKKIPHDFLLSMLDKMRDPSSSQSFLNYLSFIISELSGCDRIGVVSEEDYRYTVGEFFSMNYSDDIHISDLASTLHLSDMQTQRVVKKITGKTFGENLLMYRMMTAEHMIKNTQMSLSDISEYVGYRSYNGFRKALAKFRRMKVVEETKNEVIPD